MLKQNIPLWAIPVPHTLFWYVDPGPHAHYYSADISRCAGARIRTVSLNQDIFFKS